MPGGRAFRCCRKRRGLQKIVSPYAASLSSFSLYLTSSMATEKKNSVPLADSVKSGLKKPEITLTPTPADGSQDTAETVSPAPTHEKAASGGTEKALSGGSSKREAAQGATNGASSESANDIEKKLRRAERFGLPLQLSEQEKRSSRAERFGNVSGSDASKSSEDLKRKARAERFGVAASSTVDEEEKKKARLAKFASSTKVDTQEEEKRKARALRFAQRADSPSHANGKGTIEMNASVTSDGVGGT